MSVLSKAHMYDEAAAFKHVEGMLWVNRPSLPPLPPLRQLR